MTSDRASRRSAPPAAHSKRQHVSVLRRLRLEQAGLGRPGDPASPRGAGAWVKPIYPLPRNRGEPVDGGTRRENLGGGLRSLYGHIELGVHAEVVEGGRFAVGDAIEVLPE